MPEILFEEVTHKRFFDLVQRNHPFMKPHVKNPSAQALLHFDDSMPNLQDLRTEISSCLVTGQNLWLSYDEDAGIERLSKTKQGYGYHKHYELTDFFDLPDGSGEVDLESLAYEPPYLWFCGSMSLKRDSPDADDPIEEQLNALQDIAIDQNRFSLGCIPCLERDGSFELLKSATYDGRTIRPRMLRGGASSSELHNALMRDPHLGPYMTIPCKDNGFDIEGLAVQGERVFIGLRGPVLNGWAVILEIFCQEMEDILIMRQRDQEDRLYRKHFVDLRGMGIRELNIDSEGDLYLLAGPTMDLDGTISLYRIRKGLPDQQASVTHKPERLFDVARGSKLQHGEDKAEGMAFVDDSTVLITYDSPQESRIKSNNQVYMDLFEL